MSGMSSYRVELKIKNNLIVSRIYDMGFDSIIEFCQYYKLQSTQVYELINLKTLPKRAYKRKGEITWRNIVIKLAEIFKCTEEDLFSDNQLISTLDNNKYAFELDETAMMDYYLEHHNTQTPEQLLLLKEKKEGIEEMLCKVGERLGHRKEQILRSRSDNITYTDIGYSLNVGAERVRQMERDGLRYLRHPNMQKWMRKKGIVELTKKRVLIVTNRGYNGIKKDLKKRGFLVVEDLGSADVVVIVSFNRTADQKTYEYYDERGIRVEFYEDFIREE